MAAAQDAEADDDTIVVTAQRRAESILEVPISITAIGAAEIDERGVEQLRDLQFAIPGLFVADRGPSTTQIQLRGVSQFVGSPTIGSYIDELSIAPSNTGTAISPQLIDLERVEVLRGPQPALYGENSMGGTIRYITANPNLKEVEGSVGGEIAGTEGGDPIYRTEGVINLPLVDDKLAVRVSGVFEEAGGWIDTPRENNANVNTVSQIRGKVLYKPVESVELSLLVLNQNSEEDESSFAFEDDTLPTPGQGGSEDDFTLGNFLASWDTGPVTILSSTGFIDRDVSLAIDQSDFSIPFYGLFGATIDSLSVVQENSFERFSQELRVTSNGEGPLTYVFGATYIDDESTGESASVTSPIPVDQLPFDLFGVPESTGGSEFWTIYGQLDYQLTERFEVQFGARYFEDEQSLVLAPGVPEESATFSSFNPKFSANFDTGNGIVFATIAKGFRSGGFNALALTDPAVPLDFDPETIWTYEIGTKQALFDGRLTVDLTVYYNEWSDIQQNPVPNNGIPQRFVVNGGEASGFGIDSGLLFEATEHLTLSATGGWTFIEYDEASATHAEGDPLDLVPEFTGSLSADYRRPITDKTIGFGRLDFNYTDESQNTLRNLAGTGIPEITFTDARRIVNARLGVEYGKVEVYAFGENLLNDNGITYPAVGTIAIPVRPRPMVIGFGANVQF
ncbi:MAG: TonB-dependent receptor [Pseudomonadota bacterium]